MKITETQLYPALNEFIERSIMPLGASMNLQDQFLFGFKIGIAKRKIQNVIKSYLAKDSIKAFDLVDEQGYIDIETMYQSALDVFSQMKQIEVLGITFREDDLQTLYSIIQKYAKN